MTRLIDADALNEKLCKTTIFIKDGEVFQRMINDAPTIEPTGDLISRQDALAEFVDGRDVFDIMESIEELPSVEAEQVTGKLNKRDDSLLKSDSDECKEQKSKLDLISREEVLRMIIVAGECEPDLGYTHLHNVIESLPSATSAEVEDRLYIKIYADDEPSVKAEKLYQICDETQNREVAEWLKEYFPSAELNPLCALADRECPFQGKEYVWCLTCPHISEEDRNLIKRAIEPKTGEWMRNNKIGTFKIFTCDKCGCNMDTDAWDFCPNCGADMRGEEE